MISTSAYVGKHRHGIYYFRAVIPQDLRQHFPNNRREIKRSLKTDSKKLAIVRARAYSAMGSLEMAIVARAEAV